MTPLNKRNVTIAGELIYGGSKSDGKLILLKILIAIKSRLITAVHKPLARCPEKEQQIPPKKQSLGVNRIIKKK